MRLLALSCWTLLVPTAMAAEVTDAPPQWRGDVHVAYDGHFEQVGLQEDASTYGIRNTTRHDLGIRLEVAAYKGLLVTIGLPITIQQRIAFPAAREMVFEPTTGRGSYASGQPIDADPIVSGGLQGAWFGVGLVPFSSTYARSLPVEARFDVAVRTGGGNQTLYSPNRGASPGGPALRLAGAFSYRRNKVDPYITIAYQREFPTTVGEVIDNAGVIWATDLAVKAGDTVDAVAGAEFVVAENTDSKLRVAIDVHGGVGYRGWEDRASGFWLPSVLDNSRSLSVTRGDFVQVTGGAGVDVHLNRFIGLRAGAEGAYFTPRTVESTYRVRTDGPSYGVRWYVGVVGRVRLKGD